MCHADVFQAAAKQCKENQVDSVLICFLIFSWEVAHNLIYELNVECKAGII